MQCFKNIIAEGDTYRSCRNYPFQEKKSIKLNQSINLWDPQDIVSMFNNVQHQGWETDQQTDTAVMWKIHEDSPFNHVPDREEALHLCANFLSLGSFGEEEEGGR